jgi:hypothetical protein
MMTLSVPRNPPPAWYIACVIPAGVWPLTLYLFCGLPSDSDGHEVCVTPDPCAHFVLNVASPARARLLDNSLIVDDGVRRELDGVAKIDYVEAKVAAAFEYRVNVYDNLEDHPLAPCDGEDLDNPAFFRFAKRYARPVPSTKHWAIRAPYDFDYPRELTSPQRIKILGYDHKGLNSPEPWYSPELLSKVPCYYSQGFVCREAVFRVLRPHLIEPFFVVLPLHELPWHPPTVLAPRK